MLSKYEHLKLGERFGFMNYGYLWYKPYDDKEVYAAIGDSGNIIYDSYFSNCHDGDIFMINLSVNLMKQKKMGL
jgi:hypothetical protein